MDDGKDILSANEGKLTDEDLLRYLNENLSEEDKINFEKKVSGAFEQDAIVGLKQIKDKASLQTHVLQLNQKLPQMLRSRKHRSTRKKLKDLQWTILAIIILLFFCIMGYFVIRMHNNISLGIYKSSIFLKAEKGSSNS